jgi:hypothetical protein
VPRPGADRPRRTWAHADAARIEAALTAAAARDPGGWYVAGAGRQVRRGVSTTRTVAGREVVFWRDTDGVLNAGPGICPHLGALLDRCPVVDGSVRCRWHGMTLPSRAAPQWTPYRAFDDGILVWVQFPTAGGSRPMAPVLPDRPDLAASIAAVISRDGICEPGDIIADLLEPWLHPDEFGHISVDDAASNDQRLVVDVAFRLNQRWGMPVRAEFNWPDARTAVMRIVEGEGAGSVVETHATPLGPDERGRPRTRMTEVTVVHSARAGFRIARHLAPLVRPAVRRTAHRLWRGDMTSAERRYALRAGGGPPAAADSAVAAD